MGTYCTTTSLETLWGGTSFDNMTALASEFIDEAESEINKKLSQRYDMSSNIWATSTSVPPVVTTICKWLSIGYLYEATARGSKDAFKRADRYLKKAEKNLDDLVAYKASLVDSDGEVIADASDNLQIISSTEDYAPTFNEDDEKNWEIDPTKVTDIASDRS